MQTICDLVSTNNPSLPRQMLLDDFGSRSGTGIDSRMMIRAEQILSAPVNLSASSSAFPFLLPPKGLINVFFKLLWSRILSCWSLVSISVLLQKNVPNFVKSTFHFSETIVKKEVRNTSFETPTEGLICMRRFERCGRIDMV